MTAVALSTLRNDIDGAESPLDVYQPGAPWPCVDPNKVDGLYPSPILTTILFFLGMGRTPEERTRYNASRPLPVLGGASDSEISFLQTARGPYAKTQLCWFWLSEFITREHLRGSLGEVGAPIVSRVFQFLADGMMHYNSARKIMFVPFPFPHAQLSAAFTLIMVPLLPFLMDQTCETNWLGAVLTFCSMVCLSGIHEVARELENPFRNVPNELPVVTFMAEFNEALVTVYSGWHPDFYWQEMADELCKPTAPQTSCPSSQGSSCRSSSGMGSSGISTSDPVLEELHEDGRKTDLTKESPPDPQRLDACHQLASRGSNASPLLQREDLSSSEGPKGRTWHSGPQQENSHVSSDASMAETEHDESSWKSNTFDMAEPTSQDQNHRIDGLQKLVEQQDRILKQMLEDQQSLNRSIAALIGSF